METTARPIRLSQMLAFTAVLIATPLRADDAIAPASERFGKAAAEREQDEPDFQQHVAPLLGRLGCNGRSCHGSFQGQGGFRLSLFGYDFKMDHDALTGQASSTSGARVNRGNPQRSLILRKPTLDVEHEGGRRFKNDSWEHRLLRRWIECGAPGVKKPRELKRLEVAPHEVIFNPSTTSVSLKVMAVWADGRREDVTCLCRFRTNDDSIATVTADGVIASQGPGDSHVVVFYDNGVTAVPVMRAVSSARPPQLAASTRIDQLVNAKLGKLRIAPSKRCGDAEFLRRVSIDMTGTLPTPNEVTAFLADRSQEKRAAKIDELLQRDSYAACWANRLCDFTGCNPNQQAELGQETAVQWYMWIYKRVRENLPYDELVERIVVARGRDGGQTYDDYAAATSAYFRNASPDDFAQRETMPHYWTRRTMKKPADKALAFAHSFLGVRLQCAQCHKHPWARWTQHDFQQFTAFFDNVQFGVRSEDQARYRELAGKVGLRVRGKQGSPIRKDVLKRAEGGRVLPWRELYIGRRPAKTKLSLLRSRVVHLDRDEDPRRALMDWMKEPDHPWFARSLVNRVWAGYFHVGIIEPPDDLSPANPPSNPELLDWLTKEFVAHGYDMKWLHRQIALSDAYQRSWKPNETNRDDKRNFSRAIPRRLPAEVIYDGLKQATAASDKLDEVRRDLSRRAIGHLSMRLAGTYAMHVFGKPERAVNCDCERVNQPTLLQSVFLHNDPLVEQRLDESGWIEEIARAEASKQPVEKSELIRAAWLRALGRPPTSRESARAEKHLSNTESVAEGMRDLLWALINTKEFVLNR